MTIIYICTYKHTRLLDAIKYVKTEVVWMKPNMARDWILPLGAMVFRDQFNSRMSQDLYPGSLWKQ